MVPPLSVQSTVKMSPIMAPSVNKEGSTKLTVVIDSVLLLTIFSEQALANNDKARMSRGLILVFIEVTKVSKLIIKAGTMPILSFVS